MKKTKLKNVFLEELRRIPIVQVVCEKVGVSRVSVYRWRNKDEKFSEEMDTALAEGEALINDMTEAQLLNLIKEQNWNAISFWLRHRNPKFKETLEITGKIKLEKKLDSEQEELLREGLRLALPTNKKSDGQ